MLSPRLDGGAINIYNSGARQTNTRHQLPSNNAEVSEAAETHTFSTHRGSNSTLREVFPQVADAWEKPEPKLLLVTRALELAVS